ncbi:hypothetical protein Tco_0781581 [Tanacetum coccineum]
MYKIRLIGGVYKDALLEDEDEEISVKFRFLEETTHGESNDKEVSSDPFNIYDLLDKRTKEVRTTDTSTSILTSGFNLPHVLSQACNNQDILIAESDRPPSRSEGVIREYW